MMIKPYGCHNREMRPGYDVPVRMYAEDINSPPHLLLPIARVEHVRHATSTDCKYTKERPEDERCAGCRHREGSAQ